MDNELDTAHKLILEIVNNIEIQSLGTLELNDAN